MCVSGGEKDAKCTFFHLPLQFGASSANGPFPGFGERASKSCLKGSASLNMPVRCVQMGHSAVPQHAAFE